MPNSVKGPFLNPQYRNINSKNMSLNKGQVDSLRAKGIHYERQWEDVEDLVYSFSAFNKRKGYPA